MISDARTDIRRGKRCSCIGKMSWIRRNRNALRLTSANVMNVRASVKNFAEASTRSWITVRRSSFRWSPRHPYGRGFGLVPTRYRHHWSGGYLIFPGFEKLHHAVLQLQRSGWIAGLISVLGFLLIWVLLIVHAPTVMARELLARAAISEQKARPQAGQWSSRRIEIRHGNRTFRREVLHGGAPHNNILSGPDPELAPLIRASPVDWADPLSSEKFSKWRASLPAAKDEVNDQRDFITVTTSVPLSLGLPIQLASIVLRKPDLHVVRERVEFQKGAPIEVFELAYEINTATPALASSPLKSILPASALPKVPMVITRPAYSDEQLETLEAEVRTTLHSLDVGLDGEEGEVVIHRNPIGILVETVAATEARGKVLRDALRKIPGVEARIRTNEIAGSRPIPKYGASTLPPSKPLLEETLNRHFGSEAIALDYAMRMRDAGSRIAVLSGRLLELAKRYPEDRLMALPKPARTMVDGIAFDLLRKLTSTLDTQASLLMPILRVEFPELGATESISVNSQGITTSWPQEIPTICTLSATIAHNSNHLFASVSPEAPEHATVRETLQSLLQSQNRLSAALHQLSVGMPQPAADRDVTTN